MAGTNLWGTAKGDYSLQKTDDGLLEVRGPDRSNAIETSDD